MQRIKVARALLPLWFSAAVWAQQANYQLDAKQTKVTFAVGDTLHAVHGTFKLKTGNIQFDPVSGSISGQVTVDAASGDSGSAGRDSRMNAKILEADRYPDIVFRPDRVDGKVAPDAFSDVRIHGIFSIHGADHEITVPAHVRLAGSEFAADLSFRVPYVKWGMKNPSLLILRVGDQVDIAIHAVGSQGSATTAP